MNYTTRLTEISTQLLSLLNQLDNTSYSQNLKILSNASIGQHFRHILDFYNCLIIGAATGRIDYAKRARNPQIETDIAFTKCFLEEMCKKMAKLEESQTIELSVDVLEEENAYFVPSSIGRELLYAFDHTIHHLAIIKIGVENHFPNIQLSQELGVAPSTLKYRNQQQAMQISAS